MRIAALLGIILTGLCIRQISDPDIWFYLVVAREAMELGQIPANEFYVYPALGEPAHFSAFGFGLLHYLMYQLGGVAGMAMLNALLCGGALLALLFAARKATCDKLSLWHGLLPIAIAYTLAEFRMTYRPETTLFLFLAIELLILERWLAEARPRLLVWIPVLAFLLAQLHTTSVFIWVVYLAYALHWALGKGWRQLRTLTPSVRIELAWLTGCGALSLVLPILNPFGQAQLTILFQSLSTSLSASGDNPEYLPILITEYRYHFIALTGLLAAAWGSNPQRRWVDLILILAFGWLAFRYVRNLGLFAMIAVIPLAHALNQLQPAFSGKATAARSNMLAALAALGVMTSVAHASGNWKLGFSEKVFPVAGIQAIRQVSPGGNVLNFFHHGSYIAWALGPRYKVAIDGHFVTPTRANEYHDSLFRADPGWERQLHVDQVIAIVSPATLPFSGELIPLIEKLANDPRWALVAIDAEALTFVPTHKAKNILPKTDVWHQVLRETSIVIKDNPNTTRAQNARATAEEKLAASPQKVLH